VEELLQAGRVLHKRLRLAEGEGGIGSDRMDLLEQCGAFVGSAWRTAGSRGQDGDTG